MPPSARVPQRAHCPSCICKPHCLLGNQRETELQAWAPFLTERAFRKGERLLQQGHTESTLRVIKVGMVLALPINILAGLLGMNVGGIPLADSEHGFWVIVDIFVVFTAVAGWLALRGARDK